MMTMSYIVYTVYIQYNSWSSSEKEARAKSWILS